MTKMEIFQIQDGGWTPHCKSFSGYMWAFCCPINAEKRNLNEEAESHVDTLSHCCKIML